ncbi:MAG: hypothetical protein ABI651_20380 [Verrucomicrobiota bacterium]
MQDDKILWQEAVDNVLPANRPVEVLITILEGYPNGRSAEEQARRRVAAVQELAALNAFSEMPDPALWQREIREDRYTSEANAEEAKTAPGSSLEVEDW